ncbi:hypothetical protein CEUSTIGMA_g8388.t1 [Chlamydomonas eustigma]|uniref:Fungal lipase-type domain-containing protein n=1 Tax=Chlamydomonas eustigma TaxID=1157962 RepID=A0A250XCZ0_9CHLO|nr:hypothetical protein CEUSTIGMA_g8388.t1 [Chlamydomonas eustigma]|eukprot:GAX80953.1 hypothetical protein CEUSTIGMA_g8388.t1 [Chlamydomonas eustigma]
MSHLAWTSVYTADPICKVFRSSITTQRKVSRFPVETHAASTSGPSSSSSSAGDANARSHHLSVLPYSGVDMATVYSTVKSRISTVWSNHRTSLQGLLDSVASVRKKLSYPDLSTYLTNSVTWLDSKSVPHDSSELLLRENDESTTPIQSPTVNNYISEALSQPLLQPFIERADRWEVQYAALLSDLSNMAYEVHKIESEALLKRHHLILVTSSSQPVLGPITREIHWEKVKAAHSAGRTWEQQQQEEERQAEAAKMLQNQLPQLLLEVAGRSSFEEEVDEAYAGRPLSPDIEYSVLLGSMDEMLPDDEEYLRRWSASRDAQGAVQHMMVQQLLGSIDSLDSLDVDGSSHGASSASAAAAQAAMSRIEQRMTRAESKNSLLAHFSFANGLDSMASVDDYWPEDESVAMHPALPPHTPVDRHMQTPTRPSSIPSSSSGASVGQQQQEEAAADLVDRMPGSPQSASLLEHPEPPAAWFVSDDPVTSVRYIVIQGSTSFNHWTINFKFDPVIFEDPALGVRVHRGVYEAALRMYEDLLPVVQQHLASAGPSAKISLSGHSLGGSLASVLLLLFVYRRVLPPSCLSPCYTFGAPAVFCVVGPAHGNDRVSNSGDQQEGSHHLDVNNHKGTEESGEAISTSTGSGARRPVMEQLGIADDLLNNVMMHKDIVPRAFVCDYTAVADMLKRWMPSFRDHSTLSNNQQHKSLYNFIGRVAVLRPDDRAPFVNNDNFHPMLPDEPGLYKLNDPASFNHTPLGTDTDAHRPLIYDATSASYQTPLQNNILHNSSQHGVKAVESRSCQATSRKLSSDEGATQVNSLGEAMLQFMNYPHPLQTLSMYESYGPNGAISRFHNPDNYTKGLQRLPEMVGKTDFGGDCHVAGPFQSHDRSTGTSRCTREQCFEEITFSKEELLATPCSVSRR